MAWVTNVYSNAWTSSEYISLVFVCLRQTPIPARNYILHWNATAREVYPQVSHFYTRKLLPRLKSMTVKSSECHWVVCVIRRGRLLITQMQGVFLLSRVRKSEKPTEEWWGTGQWNDGYFIDQWLITSQQRVRLHRAQWINCLPLPVWWQLERLPQSEVPPMSPIRQAEHYILHREGMQFSSRTATYIRYLLISRLSSKNVVHQTL